MFDFLKSVNLPAQRIISQLPEAIIILIVGVVTIFILRMILMRVLSRSRVGKSVAMLISSIATFLFWIILIILILRSLGFTSLVIAFSGAVAIAGLTLANGGKDLIGNVLSGISLALDKDFNVGDHIKTNDIEGEVVTIDIRKIRIKGKDGNYHIVPTSTVDQNPWVLYKKGEKGE